MYASITTPTTMSNASSNLITNTTNTSTSLGSTVRLEPNKFSDTLYGTAAVQNAKQVNSLALDMPAKGKGQDVGKIGEGMDILRSEYCIWGSRG